MKEELEFIISTKEQGAEEAQQKSTNAIQQVGKVFTTVRENVRQAAPEIKRGMDTIVSQISSAAAVISNKYNNMSLTQLQNEFVKIEERIQKQEAIVRQANQALNEYGAFLDDIERRSGGAGAATADYDGELASLAKTAGDAKRSLEELKAQQQQIAEAISTKTAGAQQMEQMNAQLTATKVSGAQAKMGLDIVANGLTVTGRAAGGTISQFTALAQEVRFLKQGFTTTAATAGTTAATISTVFGAASIAITAVMLVINAVAQAEEEARRKAKELQEEINSLSSDNQGAAKLVTEFEKLNNKAVKTADETQRMLDIRAELVETYGFSVAAVDEEGRLLAGNLNLMQEQLRVSREMLYYKLKENDSTIISTYNTELEKQKTLYKDIADYKYRIDHPAEGARREIANDPVKRLLGTPNWNQLEALGKDYINEWESKLDVLEAKAKVLSNDAKAAINDIFRQIILEIQLQREVPEAIQKAVSAMMEEGFLNGLSAEDIKSSAQAMIDAYFTIDTSVADSSIAVIGDLRTRLITAAVSGDGNSEDPRLADFIEGILNNVMGDEAMQAAYDRAAELKQKIYKGLASPEEMTEYDNLIGQIGDKLQKAQSSTIWKPAVDALRDLRKEVVITSGDLIKMAAAEAASNKTLKDAASDLRSVASGYENVSKAVKEVADMKSAVKVIEDYNGAAVKSEKLTKDYASAKAWLADKYGVEKDAIDGMLPTIKDDIELKEALALADYLAGLQAAQSAQAQVIAMQTAGTITDEQATKMINALNDLIAKYKELAAYSISDGSINNSNDLLTVTRRGGGGSRNKQLEKEMALLNHKRALDQVTTAEEIANLEHMLKHHAKTTAEKRKLIEEIYALKRQKEREDLDYQEAMDRLTLREKIDALTAVMETYKKGTAARRELEMEIYELTRQLERQEYELKVHYGQLTLAEQEAYLKQLIESYEEGVEARIELEQELYDVQQSIRQQHIDELSSLADAVVSAFRERYEAMRDTEKETLQASIEAWKEWGDTQIEVLQAQIKAIDEVSKAEDDAEVEAAKRRRVAALEQQLQYEQDAYNRRKIQDELAKAQDDLNQWLRDKERDAQKAALQAQIDNINKTVDDQTAALEDRIDAVEKYYAELTEEQKLQAEAQKLIMQGSQEDILALLESYASDYNLSGKSLGEQWLDGFMSVVGDVEAWLNELISRFTAFQTNYMQQLASTANAAADEFYARQNAATTNAVTENNTRVISPTIQITIMGTGSGATGLTPSEEKELVEKIVAAMTYM